MVGGVKGFSIALFPFSSCHWSFGWSLRKIALPRIRCNSLYSKEGEQETGISRTSKYYTGLLFGFKFDCAGSQGHNGGGAFGGSWSWVCSGGCD